MAKNAEIIAVGSELLTPNRLDTNSLFVTQQLNLLGVEIVAKQIIGDDLERLTGVIASTVARSDIVIVMGGLGPTKDDVTREAAAHALGRKLLLSAEQESILRNRFRQFNRPMAPNNLQQAYLIDGAEAMPNARGTAPGQFISTDRCAIALLPGPPRELELMVEKEFVPRLKQMLPPQVIRVRTFRITGIGESDLDTLISPVYSKYTNPATTVLSSPGDLFVHLRARCDSESEAHELLRQVGDPIAELLGDRVYSDDADDTLDLVIARQLRQRHATVATAESCTGGLLATRLTDAAGSSDYFVAGYVTYTDQQKREILCVPADLIARHSAVSEPVAAAMAEGARARSGADYALSTTGYAGPSGGTDRDPVGTVYLGLAGPDGTRVVRLRYGADRYRTRVLAAQAALDLLRKTLLK